MLNQNRIIRLNVGSHYRKGKYILYWMQQSQRVSYNHALSHSIDIANELDLPLVVYFGLTSNYPDANLRHYHFMLEGLVEVKTELNKRGIHWVLKFASPEEGIKDLLDHASYVISDQGYLRHQKLWRNRLLKFINENHPDLPYDVVDTDLIVPIHIASNKAEYGAFTIRPKLKNIYMSFRDFKTINELDNQSKVNIKSDDENLNINQILDLLELDESVKKSPLYHGGYREASNVLDNFIETKLNHYHESNDPSLKLTSHLSLYLHFGQISALEILDKVLTHSENNHVNGEALDGFIEQLLVRRELAFNYVYYQEGYDQFEHMTETWAYLTMREHESDQRLYLYKASDYEAFKTHDPYFNAAMKEMVLTGYMHNYMRMYWAKKIIEWSQTFKEAYDIIIKLNNKYFIDGRDPNSYTGVAWCFGKHDRAWTEREIFGKLRYMNESGLKRKFDIEKYVAQMNELEDIYK